MKIEKLITNKVKEFASNFTFLGAKDIDVWEKEKTVRISRDVFDPMIIFLAQAIGEGFKEGYKLGLKHATKDCLKELGNKVYDKKT
jgi:hypothetical protein